MSADDLSKELPSLTDKEKRIIDFWRIRGYDRISHTFGMGIKLHMAERYECLGLDLEYLNQFYREAQKDLLRKIQDEIKQEEKRIHDEITKYER